MVSYFSTRGHEDSLSFEDVILSGVAPDKGLYLPDSITLENLTYLTQEDLSYEDFVKTIFIALDKASAPYVEGLSLYPGFDGSPEPKLIEVNDTTLALQPLGAIADKRLTELGERGLVIVATSGDTGSAAIEAVKDSENIDIVVLHPANKISEYQRKQMTSVIKDNVLNIAINGSYDDCQRLAKELLQDNPFERRIISLNSINWLRVMGQVAYYVWLTKQFTSPINVAIPSGNFGNAYSAWYGRNHGLPIQNILCSTNINDVLKRFIDTGILEPKETYPSVAPSMDIQIPSSLERLIYDLSGDASEFYKSFGENSKAELDEKSFKALKHIFSSFTFNDDEIKNKIKDLYSEFDIIFDPHTATSVSIAVESTNNINTVAVATASPEKFANTISQSIKDYEEVNIDMGEEYIELDANLDSIVDSVQSKFN